jgi:thioredoxin
MDAMSIVTCPTCGAKNRVDETRTDRKPICGKCRTSLENMIGVTASATAAAGNGHPVEITDATFDGALRSAGDRPVLVDAWASWCGPCRMIAPTIEQLAAESNGRWVVGKLDVDRNPNTAQRYRIASIPTLLSFKRGQLVEQLVGLQPKQAIVAKLQAHAQ